MKRLSKHEMNKALSWEWEENYTPEPEEHVEELDIPSPKRFAAIEGDLDIPSTGIALTASDKVKQRDRTGPKQELVKFVENVADKVAKGTPLQNAVCNSGASMRVLRERPQVLEAIRQAVSRYALPPEVRREYVRASLNELMITGMEEGDHPKVLAAAKLISNDPTVGLNAPPQIGIQIDITDIEDVLRRAVPPKFEEIHEVLKIEPIKEDK